MLYNKKWKLLIAFWSVLWCQNEIGGIKRSCSHKNIDKCIVITFWVATCKLFR